jgi:hypothetical protein
MKLRSKRKKSVKDNEIEDENGSRREEKEGSRERAQGDVTKGGRKSFSVAAPQRKKKSFFLNVH